MTESNKPRCNWAGADPLMRRYHDEEWGVTQHDARTLWEMLMLEGFQAGLSWSIILKRRGEIPVFRRSRHGCFVETGFSSVTVSTAM